MEGDAGWHLGYLSDADRALELSPRSRGGWRERAKRGRTAQSGPPRAEWNVTTSMPGLHAFVAGEELADLVDAGHDIVVLTADLATSNRMTDFRNRHPDRFVNTGIAEQNMMSIGAGLAACGHQAWVSTFASFASLLCAEHLRTDMAVHPASSAGVRSPRRHRNGLLRHVAPCRRRHRHRSCDGGHDDACAVRRGIDAGVRAGHARDSRTRVRPGRAAAANAMFTATGWWSVRVSSSSSAADDDVTVIATGIGVGAAISAADQLREEGIAVRVLDAVSLKPLDTEAILDATRTTNGIVIVEEHNTTGGLGSAVAETVALHGLVTRISKLGIDDQYALVAPPTHLYRHYGLTAEGVGQRIRDVLQ